MGKIEKVMDKFADHKHHLQMSYSTLGLEDLFRNCFNEVLSVIESYVAVKNEKIFTDFEKYIRMFYPK